MDREVTGETAQVLQPSTCGRLHKFVLIGKIIVRGCQRRVSLLCDGTHSYRLDALTPHQFDGCSN